MRKNTFLLILILLLAAVFRLFWIDKVPHSINGDELHYLLSAKSFFLTGKDITQTITPFEVLLFHSPPGETVQAELPYFLELLSVGPLPFNMAGNAFPNTILGILTVGIIFLITKKLINEQVGVLSSFVAAVNPWFIFMGRSSYEVIPATFFYLLGFYILLITKSWKILLAFPILILAFYSYIGTKLIFLPIIILYILYCYFFVHKRKHAKEYLALLFLSILFIGFFVFQLKTAPNSRLSEIMLPNSAELSSQVNMVRKTSMDSPLLPFFENKITLYLDMLTAKILHTFSPTYLFLEGDYFTSLGKHGLFYLFDLIFLLIGGAWLFGQRNKIFILFSSLIAVSILPQILFNAKGLSYFTPHITLLIPFFIIIIGTGMWRVLTELSVRKLHFIIGIITVIYLYLIGNFINIYFFQIPIQPNFYNFPERVLSEYISLSRSKNQNILIYTPNSEGKFKEYIFYNNLYKKTNAAYIAQALLNNQHSIEGVTFSSCNKSKKDINKKDLIIVHNECGMSFKENKITLPQLSDSGAVYKIYNDKTCSKYQLNNYISNFKVSDFAVDKLSHQEFCTKFITN